MERFLKYWLPVLLWMAVIFFASTDAGSSKNTEKLVRPPVEIIKPNITQPQFKKIHFDVRKTAHFTEYAVLAFLLCRAFSSHEGFLRRHLVLQAVIVLVISMVYSWSDEFHQLFVHSRGASVRDTLIDTSGAAFGMIVYWVLARWWLKKEPEEKLADLPKAP